MRELGLAIGPLVGLSLGGWLLFTAKVVDVLERRHHAIWVELGKPVFRVHNAIHGDLMWFLFTRRYRTLNDSHLSLVANCSLASLAALTMSFAIFLLFISLAAVSASKGITSHA